MINDLVMGWQGSGTTVHIDRNQTDYTLATASKGLSAAER